MIVLDASAAIEYLVSIRHGQWVATRLAIDADVHAPHVLDIEVAGVLRRLVLERRLAEKTAREALAELTRMSIARYPHALLLPRMWQLRSTVRAADASFVALAELLGAQLVTTDLRLARAPGPRVEFVTP